MEYVPGGELFDLICSHQGIPENSAKDLFREILQGVKHCHDNGIAHRDLKLENILLDKSNKPKVRKSG
jgi:serine/threonine protein kinase